MGNIFDRVQEATFDLVSTAMGYDASWTPTNGDPQQVGRVLLKNPTEKYGYLGNQEYQLPQFEPLHWVMEFREGVFDGLKTATDTRSTQEYVTINNQSFFVSAVFSKFDGKTHIATLQPHTS
jgi:hypothetical protein